MGATMQQQPATFDALGFPLGPLTPADTEARARCLARQQQRRTRWQQYVDTQDLPKEAVLKRFCRKGIPHELRGWAWWHLSGASSRRQQGYFTRMVEQGASSKAMKQIELDLPRTFPRHPWFLSAEGQGALRQELTAYAAHNPAVGYCQSMNFVVALLLLVQDRDPERAFWMLVALVEGRLAPATYAPDLDGCQVEMRVLGQLLGTKQRSLAAHLKEVGCDVSLLSTDWFLCLFCTSLPPESAARVWDALLCEGPKVLLRVGLAVLELLGPELRKKDNAGEMVKLVKDYLSHMYDHDQLMATAFDRVGSMPGRRIESMRGVHRKAVAAMLAERAAQQRKVALKASIEAGKALQGQRSGKVAAAQADAPVRSGSSTQAATSTGGSTSNGQQQEQQQQQQGADWSAVAGQLATSAASSAAVAAESARAGVVRMYNSFSQRASAGGADTGPAGAPAPAPPATPAPAAGIVRMYNSFRASGGGSESAGAPKSR